MSQEIKSFLNEKQDNRVQIAVVHMETYSDKTAIRMKPGAFEIYI